MWNDILNNLRGADDWIAAKFANPRAGATVEALTDMGNRPIPSLRKKRC